MDNIQNQNWSYLALYYLDLIDEEQEETVEDSAAVEE